MRCEINSLNCAFSRLISAISLEAAVSSVPPRRDEPLTASAQLTLLVASSTAGPPPLRRESERVRLLDLVRAGPGVRLRDLDFLVLERALERERGLVSREGFPRSLRC